MVKSSGRGRSQLMDEAYFVYYEKSAADPQAIVARGIQVARDYSGDFRMVETHYCVRVLYVFKMGNSLMFRRYCYYRPSAGSFRADGVFEKRSSVFSLFDQTGTPVSSPVRCPKTGIKKAVRGTPFQYSTWETYYSSADDMVRFFDLYSKAPCVEYLTKLGFTGLVLGKLAGEKTYGAVNWQGKTLCKVLKINKQELKAIRSQKLQPSFLLLKLLQISQKDGSNLSLSDVADIAFIYRFLFEHLKGTLQYASLRQATEYFSKQCQQGGETHYISPGQALLAWKDYLADANRLNLDLSQRRVVFPRNLYRAHQNTIKQIRLQADAALNAKIKSRVKELQKKYHFEYEGLFVCPAQSTDELIREGKTLNHCVGTYAERYANGRTVLLLLRKKSAPDKPFFTMEIYENSIMQVRGKDNCAPNARVQKFVEAFAARKLTPKKGRATKTA